MRQKCEGEILGHPRRIALSGQTGIYDLQHIGSHIGWKKCMKTKKKYYLKIRPSKLHTILKGNDAKE